MPGRLICFVCGSPGADASLRTRQNSREPYFPFLANHDPPKGSRLITSDGVVDSCAVCYMFLTQQWDSYERTKTPAVKRLYWLKRSDNGSFTGAEMRIQGEYIAQVMGLQYPPGVDERATPENVPAHPDTDVTNQTSASYRQQSEDEKSLKRSKKNYDSNISKNSALDLSTSKKNSEYKHGYDSESDKRAEKCVCYICGDSFPLTNYNFITVADQGQGEPFFPMLERVQPFPGAEGITRQGQVKGCNRCKNVLFQQWQAYEMSGTPHQLRNFKIARDTDQERPDVKPESYASNENSSSYYCYICGCPYKGDHVRLLNTLPPKRPSTSAMFFPFVRELKRPSSAEPLRSDGTVIACMKCFGHLSYQWEMQESEGVSVYHRQYSLQFLGHKPSESLSTSSRRVSSPESEERIEPLNIHITAASPHIHSSQNSTSHHYPQGLLAIAADSDSRPVSQTSSLSVSPIKSYDIVADSKLYTATDATPSSSLKPVPHPLQQVSEIPNRVCFLCAEKCLIHKMKQINAYPSRHEAKHAQIEPFFPFLANIQPAVGADALTEDGTVIVCKVCFYSLLKQWSEYEQSQNPAHSNRWLRKYNLPNYVCYVCAVENERKNMRTISVKNFNFLLDHKAPKRSLVIDEGQRVVVCKSCAYSLMKQFTEYDRMGVPHKLRKFNWIQKSSNTVESGDESGVRNSFMNDSVYSIKKSLLNNCSFINTL